MIKYRLFKEPWNNLSNYHLDQEIIFAQSLATDFMYGAKDFELDWIIYLKSCPSIIKTEVIKHIIKLEFIWNNNREEFKSFFKLKITSSSILNSLWN